MSLKKVAVKFQESTIEKILEFKKLTNCESEANAIRLAIEISMLVVSAIKYGDKVLFESRKGTEMLVIPGINQLSSNFAGAKRSAEDV